MDKIEVVVLNEAHDNPAGMELFLAKLTQRGHSIKDAKDLLELYNKCINPETPRSSQAIRNLNAMPHGTIKRFAPITIAIVGASRRFLAQARTNQVGFDYVSASLQYSDYTDAASFVVPYPLVKESKEHKLIGDKDPVHFYLTSCMQGMVDYKRIAKLTDNDTAGYAAPQGLRNVLVMQGNHQSWDYFIRLRSCNRNTLETQYVTLLIWNELLKTTNGAELFAYAGPDCMYGTCREGKMCCGSKLHDVTVDSIMNNLQCSLPEAIIRAKFPAILN